MDVVQLVGLSSVTGAGLFFSVGLLVSRAFPSKAGANPQLTVALQGEKTARERAEEQTKALQQQAATLQQKHDDVAQQLAAEKSQAAALRAKAQNDGRATEQLHNETRLREQAQQEVQRLTALVSRLEAEAGQLRAAKPPPAADTKPLADENARLRAQVTQFGVDAEGYRTRVQQREAELNEARAQLAAAQRQAQTAEAAAAQLRGAAQAASGAQAQVARVHQLEAKVAELTAKATQGDAKAREVQQLTAQLTAAQSKVKESQQLAQQLATAQSQLAAAQSQLAAAQGAGRESQQLAQQLAAAQAKAKESQQLAQQLAAAQAQVQQLTQQLTAAQGSSRESQQLAQQLAAAQAEVQKTQVAIESRSQEVARLKDENSALRQQVGELQTTQEPQQSVADIQRRNVELSLKARALEQRSQEFEMQAAEIESLRGKVEQLTSAANETAALRLKVRDLEARGFADRTAKGEGSLKRPAREAGDRLENLLEGNLEALVQEETGCRTAVLADLRGLLIAASGDITYQDELAAAASLTTYTTERIRQLVPMGEPLSIQLMDVNRVVLRTHWLRWQNDAFLLTTLGVAPAEHDIREDRAQAIISELLGT